MRLDAADLAILEIDVEKLEPLGRDVAKMLIDRIRDDEELVYTSDRRVELAIDGAKDALLILKQLRHTLDEQSDLPRVVDEKADELEETLDRICEGRET